MARIFVDSNIFMDFYQSAHDRLKVFEDLVGLAHLVVLTEQSIDEFLRNRSRIIQATKRQFEESLRQPPFMTSMIKEVPEFRAVVDSRKQLLKAKNVVIGRLEDLLRDPDHDPLFCCFQKLIVDKNSLLIPHSASALELAQKRKLLGNPPASDKKKTIGDEYHWELLLEELEENLVIVTRDASFHENFAYLAADFNNEKRRLLKVTGKVSEAVELLGEATPKEIKAEEDEWDSGICSNCGTVLEETGYEGSDGDSAWWMECPKCHRVVFPPASDEGD